MNVYRSLFIVLILQLLLGCSYEPKPIEYGKRECEYCKMTIVDQIHATEIVTQKGKAYMFDATECMLNYLNSFDGVVARHYTNHYSQAGELIDATQATYLISKNLPSPMGAFITAFKEKSMAEAVRNEKEGTLYSWEELIVHLNP